MESLISRSYSLSNDFLLLRFAIPGKVMLHQLNYDRMSSQSLGRIDDMEALSPTHHRLAIFMLHHTEEDLSYGYSISQSWRIVSSHSKQERASPGYC